MRARFVIVDGVLTRYLFEARHPVLLLHGFGGCADGWIRNVDALGPVEASIGKLQTRWR